MSPKRVAGIARRATGKILVKRVLIDKFTLPDITSADYDNPINLGLIEGIEAQDENVESDGSVIADAPLYSRIVAMKLKTIIHGSSAGGELVRWMLVKNPDGDISNASFMAGFQSSNDDRTSSDVRSHTYAKGIVLVQPSRNSTSVPVFIKRKTLNRMGVLNEGDVVSLIMAKDATGTSLQVTCWGNIWIRANA